MSTSASLSHKSKDLRDDIAAKKFTDETTLVSSFLSDITLSDQDSVAIENDAIAVVNTFRSQPEKQTLLDAFLQEYGLSNKEGIALMCLAEALLRVPDKATRDDLIADKIAPGDWAAHIGQASTLLVNTSTWGLLLTGHVTAMDEQWNDKPASFISKLTNKLGEPVIRQAVGHAMRILGGEFVLGETIKKAIARGRKLFSNFQIYSFDMLGEGARTYEDAERYYEAYLNAIKATGNMKEGGSVFECSGVSVKLSALHPKYDFAHKEAIIDELGQKLLILMTEAAKANIKLTIDAEEADRLELSLDLFEYVARQFDLSNWSGFGLAIQTYGKRARPVIRWVANLARELNCKFMVRLVKGAYWDAEIKHAQELGLPGFTVFTRKSTTDLSYMVCAQDMLANSDVLFCQFATHNAHTLSAIMHLGKDLRGKFEFQRLHGMGEAVYDVARAHFTDFPTVRIYAPVGGHKDLLAYLVRRLLENGANSSFVNRFMDAEVPAKEVVASPVRTTRNLDIIPHPQIKNPQDLFRPSRDNSTGLDLTSEVTVQSLTRETEVIYTQEFSVTSFLGGYSSLAGSKNDVINPANQADVFGQATYAHIDDIQPAFGHAQKAYPAWNKLGGDKRAEVLEKAADLFETRKLRLIALLTREAGKNFDDGIAEVRETVDFCRYYAAQARAEFTKPISLPSPTGEANSLSLNGRGTFVCISPWNFPLAIFVGQTVAALAAGNSVLTKPAEQTPIVASEAVKILYEAGVPEDVLMLVLGDGRIGARLVEQPGIAGVCFTGSTQTAKRINMTLAEKSGPIIPLIAETGGQNVMFVDSTALLEQVTDDVIQSAFKSAGQRCSALRVLYLQEDIADQALTMIKGAMQALSIGDPRHLKTDIGPIIDESAAAGLTAHIEDLKNSGTPYFAAPMSDEMKAGSFVQPHLFEIENIRDLHKEHFGPVLHVIRYKASELDETFESAFSTGYGLTLGIHTRMDRRWQEIFDQAPVGNTYVNRNITGAVVGSQPFGGQGLSGTGFKAGGPHYLYRFATEKTLTVNTMASGGNTELLTLEG